MDPNTITLLEIANWSSWVTAVATFVLAFLTGIYVWVTHRILKAQSAPCVIVSVVHDDTRPSILQLVVRNIGRGLAHDVTFEASRPIPARAWGITLDKAQDPEIMSSGPLIDGIPALGPGEERRIDWGQYGGLFKCIGEEPIVVKCSCKKNGKLTPPTRCKLEVKSFAGTCVSERDPAVKLARELEKIAKELNHLGSGFHMLRVELVEQGEKPHDKKAQ